MQFDWNERKAESNLKKHGISFAEAETVWGDYFYIDLFDEEHSFEENRYLIFGESAQTRLLVVSYTEKENCLRIISAREMTPKERRDYEQGHFE